MSKISNEIRTSEPSYVWYLRIPNNMHVHVSLVSPAFSSRRCAINSFVVMLRSRPVQHTLPKVLHFSGSSSFVNWQLQVCQVHYSGARTFSPCFAASSTWDLILKLLYVNPYQLVLLLIRIHSTSAVNPKIPDLLGYSPVMAGRLQKIICAPDKTWECQTNHRKCPILSKSRSFKKLRPAILNLALYDKF